MPLPPPFAAKTNPTLTAGTPQAQWNDAIKALMAGRPAGIPPITVGTVPDMTGGVSGRVKQLLTVGGWNTPPTGQNLNQWNAWLQSIGIPANTFGQFVVDPSKGTYSLYTTSPFNPQKETYGQFVKRQYGPATALNPTGAPSPLASTPKAKSGVAFPTYNAPTVSPMTPATQRLAQASTPTFGALPTYYRPGTKRIMQ